MHDPEEQAAGNARRRRIPWIPVATVASVMAGVAWVRLQPELERNLKAWLTASLALLGGLVLLGWFALSRRFAARVRWAGVLLAVVVLALGRLLVRVDGTVNGTGLPRFVWRGAGKPETAAPAGMAARGSMGDAPRAARSLPGLSDFPQFMGPGRTGVVLASPEVAGRSNVVARQVWRRPIGLGWSSFAVVGGRAWTQEQVNDEERVSCIDVATGATVWTHVERTRFSEWQGGDGPRATPTVQDGRVHAMGGTGVLVCLAAEDGRLIWRRSVLEENGLSNLTWGTSASPLVVDGLVVATGGKGSGGTVFAYRVADGSLAWKAGDEDASYASPIVATLAGRRVVLSSNATHLTAHDPATGREVLRHAWGSTKWPKASQPVVLPGDRVFLSAGYGVGCQVARVTASGDEGLKAEVEWKGLGMKTQFNSAALRGGHLYGLDDGLLACIDPATGRRLWKDGRFGSGQTLVVGDRVWVQAEAGTVHVCAATPVGFRELGRIEALASKTWNHPVVAGRYLLARNDREATCWDLGVPLE